MLNKFRSKLNERLKPQVEKRQPARLGNAAGIVDAGHGMVYARLQSGQVVKVFNNRVANVSGVPVMIGYEAEDKPKRLKVVSAWQVYDTPGAQGTVDHAIQHEYPNWDTLWVHLEQIKWLLCLPLTGFTVQLYGGPVYRNAALITIDNQVIDLTSLVPATGALYALIESDDTGVVTAKVDAGLAVTTKELLTNAKVPAVTAGSFALCAVRLYDSQTELQRDPTTTDDFYDLRFSLISEDTQAAHNQNASTIIIPSGMGTPTFDDVQDYLNNMQSSGRLHGGALTAHAGPDGTLDIGEMEGMIHTANNLGSPLVYFKKAAVASISLTDTAVNYIIITYTAPGGVPTLTYSASASRPADNTYNAFVVGRVWRSGNDVEAITTGQNIYDVYGRAQNRLLTKYGTMDHATGGVLSAHATPLRLSCTAGVWYFGNTRIDTPAVGHVGDKFYVWYKTGGGAWTESSLLTLFSEVFDGGTRKVYETYQNGTSLATLSGSKYGVYWIFMCPEGDLYVVLGTGDYANIGAAQAATVPASLPPYLVNWGILIGRVICQKTAAAFYSVESVFATRFTLSAAVDHASLGNLAYADSGHTGFEWDGDIADIDLDGGTDIGAALADVDLILVDDGAGGTNRKAALSRVKTYIGGWSLITDTVIGAGGAANFDFTSIPATYKHLKIVITARTNRAATGSDPFTIKFNNDGGNNYYCKRADLSGTSTIGGLDQYTAGAPPNFAYANAANAPANVFANYEITIYDYANATTGKSFMSFGGQMTGTSAGSEFSYSAAGAWVTTSAIDRITLTPDKGAWIQYCRATLYGIA